MKTIGSKKSGFSMVEVTIVMVVLGIIATFAVPRFMTSAEQTKASEAFTYLTKVERAQGRYHAEHGQYAEQANELDIEIDNPEFYTVGSIVSSNWKTAWELTLTRNRGSSGYRQYTVVFNQNGYSKTKSTIGRNLAPAP